MAMKKKSKTLQWLAVAKCVSVSNVGFVITKSIRRLPTYESILRFVSILNIERETEERPMRI
jgi:hypothetical protein